ncbi:MAG: MFS transporter [Deltaproteobacteria bacterium]|nr:MFS transporter [Deltaproteobacteria bacterium]
MFPLSAFYFLYFTGLGVFFPYFTVYLRENAGLNGAEVGLVMAVTPLVGIVAQPFWGQVADRSGARATVLSLVTLAGAAACAALALADGFSAFVLGTALMASVATAVIPISLSLTFGALHGRGPHAFGRVRVWGSIGYLLAVALYPPMLHRLAPAAADGVEPALRSLFPLTAAFMVAAALLWPWLPRGGATALRAPRGEWRVLLRSTPLRRLILYSFGGYLFLQGPTGLFPLFIRARGGNLVTVGRMWVAMLLLEIPLILLAGAGLRRLGARGLLGLGVLAGGVRWLGCGLSDDMAVIYVLQLLHGVVVTGLLLGGPMYAEQVVPQSLRSTAQSLLSVIAVGLGGILSNTLTGWMIDAYGANLPFILGGIGGILLGCAVPLVLPKTTTENTENHG